MLTAVLFVLDLLLLPTLIYLLLGRYLPQHRRTPILTPHFIVMLCLDILLVTAILFLGLLPRLLGIEPGFFTCSYYHTDTMHLSVLRFAWAIVLGVAVLRMVRWGRWKWTHGAWLWTALGVF